MYLTLSSCIVSKFGQASRQWKGKYNFSKQNPYNTHDSMLSRHTRGWHACRTPQRIRLYIPRINSLEWGSFSSQQDLLKEKNSQFLSSEHAITTLLSTNFTLLLATSSITFGKTSHSLSFTRSCKVSTVSFGRTGTTSWAIMPPASTSSYNKR